MKESFWGYWIIVLGIFVVIVMMLISNVTTTNTQDYYLIKDVAEAAMVDAVDYSYYRQYRELKINREKFVENFMRRFAENVSLSTYRIDFYDLYEAPPKVSVKVTTKSGSFSVMGDSTSFDIVNRVDSILESSGTASQNSSMSSSSNIQVDQPTVATGVANTVVYGDTTPTASFLVNNINSTSLLATPVASISNVVYYNAADQPWASTPYCTSGTMQNRGCYPLTIATILSSFGMSVTPLDVRNYLCSAESGLSGYAQSVTYGPISSSAAFHNYFGMRMSTIANSMDAIDAAMDSGAAILASVRKGSHFSISSSHYVGILMKNGSSYYVANTGRRADNGWYSRAQIQSYIVNSVNAGLWSIIPSGEGYTPMPDTSIPDTGNVDEGSSYRPKGLLQINQGVDHARHLLAGYSYSGRGGSWDPIVGTSTSGSSSNSGGTIGGSVGGGSYGGSGGSEYDDWEWDSDDYDWEDDDDYYDYYDDDDYHEGSEDNDGWAGNLSNDTSRLRSYLNQHWDWYYQCEDDPDDDNQDVCTKESLDFYLLYACDDFESDNGYDFSGFDYAYCQDIVETIYSSLPNKKYVED